MSLFIAKHQIRNACVCSHLHKYCSAGHKHCQAAPLYATLEVCCAASVASQLLHADQPLRKECFAVNITGILTNTDLQQRPAPAKLLYTFQHPVFTPHPDGMLLVCQVDTAYLYCLLFTFLCPGDRQT